MISYFIKNHNVFFIQIKINVKFNKINNIITKIKLIKIHSILI